MTESYRLGLGRHGTASARELGAGMEEGQAGLLGDRQAVQRACCAAAAGGPGSGYCICVPARGRMVRAATNLHKRGQRGRVDKDFGEAPLAMKTGGNNHNLPRGRNWETDEACPGAERPAVMGKTEATLHGRHERDPSPYS